MQPHKILTLDEIARVLADLDAKVQKGQKNAFINLIIFRLSCCCGLRCMEIAGLWLADLMCDGDSPVVRVRKENTKGTDRSRKTRYVPLDLDAGCLEDIRDWVAYRRRNNTKPTDPAICDYKLRNGLATRTVFGRWKTAVKCLGSERVSQLSTHSGRHSFGTHSLRAGYSLAEVRDWLGHSSVATTDRYTHAIRTSGVGDLWGPK